MAHELEFRDYLGRNKSNMSVGIGQGGAVFKIHNLLNGADEQLSFSLDKDQVAVLLAALVPITTGTVKN